jgi:phosphoserine aminotransferase
MLNYETMMKKDSTYNTPPVFAIYIVGKVVRWLKEHGGLQEREAVNRAKAKLVYDAVDAHADFYLGKADRDCRSLMNVTFNLPTKELEAAFVEEAKQCKLGGLKGHRSVGGIRASIYNAMPVEGCQTLADFMEKFWKEHH